MMDVSYRSMRSTVRAMGSASSIYCVHGCVFGLDMSIISGRNSHRWLVRCTTDLLMVD
jgi:hypothetical protein